MRCACAEVDELGVALVEQAVDRAIAEHDELRKTFGKKVFEIRPDIDWDNGRAVLWLLGALNIDTAASAPIDVGDDRTNDDAFRGSERSRVQNLRIRGGGARLDARARSRGDVALSASTRIRAWTSQRRTGFARRRRIAT